ncbi:hypothetical protein RHS01_06321, partial [Rhizoctonia solani]
MATRSRPPSRARSPVDQGELGPFLPPASPELGEVSLKWVIRLLWGLQSQVDRIERTLSEQAKVSREVRTNVKNISQTVDTVKDGLAQLQQSRGPHTPEEQNPLRSRKLPGPRPNPQGPPPAPVTTPAQPPAPSTVKVDHPDAFKGKIGSEAKQWLTRMLAWVRLNQRQFPSDLEVLSFLLMNMEEAAGAWAHPHLDQLGSHRALIQTVDEFKIEFLAAFGDPDATRAAERKITSLTQTGTCAEYITKFCTLQMELDWNNAALRGQFRAGLHWELQDAALIIDNALREERASHPQQGNKPGKSSTTPNQGASTGQQATKTGPLSSNPNYVSEEERNCRAQKDSATPKEDKGKAKETAKIGKDSESQLGKDTNKHAPLFTIPIQPEKKAETLEVLIDSGATSSFLHPRTAEALRLPLIELSSPRTVTMLNGSSPQAGKIWKKAVLTFTYNGKKMTETFLICNTSSHAAILGLKWLDAHNPEIDWNLRTLSFPHTPPEQVAIAEEEEADKNPLEGVPSEYHCYAKFPVMFVPKKDGSRRLVVDYRRLNSRTKKNVYPLPRPDDLMAQLRGAKVFTKLDLRWGYNNVRVKEGDEWKTAFRTKYGLYESLVMTFGLTNAPASFQHFMNKLFKDLLDVCVIIYLDDILIYSKDDATHLQHVHEVLRRLMENQLFCKASKCTSTSHPPRMAHATKVKEVQSFLGFANFLRRFVANFSHMARPLHNLVKKDTPWQWNAREQEAFQGLKDAITNALVLCHADPAKPYFLETDASGAALGSILSQCQEDGRLHPLESRTFNRRHARWHLLLAGYNFQIVYRPGKQSGKPDALSRRSGHADIPPANQTMLPDPVFANVALVTPKKELQRQIEAALDQDESLEEILQFLQNESKAPPSIKGAFKDYQMEAGLLFYQGRIVVPDVGTLRTNLLQIFHDSPLAGHPGRQRTLELVSRNYYWPGIRADTYWHVDSCETCQRIWKPKYASIPPQPLELPSQPWQHVSYDMIVDLPKDGNNDSILVIVDSFTKYVVLVECSKKLKAPELADLFLRHVWKRYGMPEKTVSDRGRVFNNKFLRALYRRLGIDPHFSLAYHPQSDGQTERVNPTVKHFLRAYSGINQKDWVKWLPMAEFAYNNAVHSATGKTPFKALYGWEPALTPSNIPTDVPEADDLATEMEAQWREVEAALRQSKERMTAGGTGEPLKTLSPKLTEQRLGPFKVTKKISNRAYRLELPPSMKIHDVFYVGLLSKVKRDKKRTFENRPPPVTVDGEEEYEVEGITDMEKRGKEWFFRVKWKGYGSEENTWEPRENLKNAEKILKKFEKEMKEKALGAAKALKGGQ